MVDFTAHFTIHNRLSKILAIYLESVVLESRSSTNSLPTKNFFPDLTRFLIRFLFRSCQILGGNHQ